jgi:hypothetical protein
LQCKAWTGTTTYDDGIETDSGTNDGTVVGTNDQTLTSAGTKIVCDVVKVSPDEMMYSVVVSMMTETVDEATECGNTVDKAGCGSELGTEVVVTVCSLDGNKTDGAELETMVTQYDDDHEEIGTETTALDGIKLMTLNGTLAGTLV